MTKLICSFSVDLKNDLVIVSAILLNCSLESNYPTNAWGALIIETIRFQATMRYLLKKFYEYKR